jgi:ornithine carbamoyltransferase
MAIRSLLTISDLTRFELFEIFERTRELKPQIKNHRTLGTLYGNIIGLLFEKPSTRTRASFEAAARRLSAESIYLSASELQTTRGETIDDTARILGKYFDALVARVYSHHTLEELAQHSGIPVINALSDLEHPTQAISDLFTLFEIKGTLKNLKLAYVGDGNNVCNSLLLGCALVGSNITVASPHGFGPTEQILNKACSIAADSGSKIKLVSEPREAVIGSDAVYTDVWVSMGQEKEIARRMQAFGSFQVNTYLMRLAKPDALVLHCLPAHRGQEITDEVISSDSSVVWQQAENKLYSAAAILEFVLSRDILEQKVALLVPRA